jgi:hypothetical protein
VDELSAGRFRDADAEVDLETDCDVDVEVDSETDWDVMERDEGVGLGVVRRAGCFIRYRSFVGEEAWFWMGSIPVPHISYSQIRRLKNLLHTYH